jgi:esterase/lipase
MKLIILLILLPLNALALSWKSYIKEIKATISHERHLPYLLSHGHKTKKSVLLIHGIYSSPLYFKSMADAYFQAGHNVVTVLLPGHWHKDFDRMKKITNEDWTRVVDRGFEFARRLGDEVILSGHSLGGLLSIEQALKRRRSEVHSVIILSPALKVRDSIQALCGIGSNLNIHNGKIPFVQPDGFQIPLFDPIAGIHIQKLAHRVLTKEIQVPVFLAYTPNDPVVDIAYLKRYYHSITSEKQLISYKIFSGIFHGDIYQRSGDSILAFGTKGNPAFDHLMDQVNMFIDQVK